MEVALFHLAVGKGDFAVQGGSQSVVDGAFHLHDDAARIRREAAVDGAPHLVNTHIATLHRYLGHFGNNTAKRFLQRDATTTARGRAAGPVGGLGHGVEHGELPGIGA